MTHPLEVVRASVGYGGDLVLRDVDVAVGASEILAVVGESGSGKSTLAKVLTGQLHPQHGQALVEGRSWSDVSRRDPARHRVQMIFQDSKDALNPWMTALETVSEAARVVDGGRRTAADKRARHLLDEVGLAGAVVDRRPSRLSGGQCQRVGIARALAHRPSVLVADEPTSALDVSVQAQVLGLLRRLRAEQDMAVVIITHDLNVVRSLADRIQVLYRGRTMEIGGAQDVLEAPAHPYSRLLVDSRPGVRGVLPLVEAQVGEHPCAFAARCPLRQPDCSKLDPSVTELLDRAPADDSSPRRVNCRHPLPGGLALLEPSSSARLHVSATADGPHRASGPGSALREGTP